MSGKRAKSPDPKGVPFLDVRASETVGTRLAHWPPPRYASESKPLAIKHRAGEPVKRAKPRGWRLTRAIFSEFSGEEE